MINGQINVKPYLIVTYDDGTLLLQIVNYYGTFFFIFIIQC